MGDKDSEVEDLRRELGQKSEEKLDAKATSSETFLKMEIELKQKSDEVQLLEDENRELKDSLEQLDEENSVVRKTLIEQRDELKEQLKVFSQGTGKEKEAEKI